MMYILCAAHILLSFRWHVVVCPLQIAIVFAVQRGKKQAHSIIKDSTHGSHGLFILLWCENVTEVSEQPPTDFVAASVLSLFPLETLFIIYKQCMSACSHTCLAFIFVSIFSYCMYEFLTFYTAWDCSIFTLLLNYLLVCLWRDMLSSYCCTLVWYWYWNKIFQVLRFTGDNITWTALF